MTDTLPAWFAIPVAVILTLVLLVIKINDYRKARREQAPPLEQAHVRDVPPAPRAASTTAPALHRMREASAPRPAVARGPHHTRITRWTHDASERRRSSRDLQPTSRRQARRIHDEPASAVIRRSA